MQTVEISTYRFDELSDEAKERARDWYRQGALDHDWSESVLEDFQEIAGILGIEFYTKTVRLMGGGTRQEPKIYFTGFASQGDGACFEGYYNFAARSPEIMRKYAPKDTELHRIADTLRDVQRPNFYQLGAVIEHAGHYYHEYTARITVTKDGYDANEEDAETVRECLRDLMRWLYRALEREHDYLLSSEVVDEVIQANEYAFTEDGKRSVTL